MSSSPVQFERIEIGIDGHYKVGRLTPVSVTVSGPVPQPVQLAVWVPDPDGNLTRQPSEPTSWTGAGPHTLTSLFRTGRMDGVIRLDLESEGRILATRTVRALGPSSDHVRVFPPSVLSVGHWVILGDAAGYDRLADEVNNEAGPRGSSEQAPITLISLKEASRLPTLPGSLDAVDIIAINGALSLSDEALAAVQAWVKQGGHLVVSSSAQEAFDRLRLPEWTPLQQAKSSRLRDLEALRGQFPRSAALRVAQLTALTFEMEQGEVLASSLDGPLAVRLPVEFGRVTLLGLDLTKAPLVTWDTLPRLCERLAAYRPDARAQRQQTAAADLSRTGVSDLSTQLATAIDQFPEMKTASNWGVMGWIALYLLCIGPLDYYFVHRILRRPHLTWITFPLLVLTSAVLASNSARHSHAPEIVSQQVSVVDLDQQSGALRTTSWSSFVSPASQRYAVEAAFQTPWKQDEPQSETTSPPAGLLSWTGVPETGFRGMYRTGGLDLAKPQYQFTPFMHSIEDLPVRIWSSSGLTALDERVLDSSDALFECDLEGAGGQLYGTITNRMDVPLEDWFIAYQNLAYFPKNPGRGATSLDFAPDEKITVAHSSRVSPRVLRNYLTGVINIRITREGDNHISDAATSDDYDPLSRDFDRIVRAISFYQATGGKEFTKLNNDALERYDLSPLLNLSRAVLFGRIPVSPSGLIVDGQPLPTDESATYIRVLLPVPPRRK